jgi:hypothetical protein
LPISQPLYSALSDESETEEALEKDMEALMETVCKAVVPQHA